eukprot:TRINITY_DN22102_c0_g5_i1.p1 TRINITY_DN22102_c0_g5~~TRINITY_DN22102_c0_g5_i1.p1  ORF type:complete len:166 (-),score=28.03 TRINITY_DN22102_c0_g5_i1:121-618(-)
MDLSLAVTQSRKLLARDQSLKKRRRVRTRRTNLAEEDEEAFSPVNVTRRNDDEIAGSVPLRVDVTSQTDNADDERTESVIDQLIADNATLQQKVAETISTSELEDYLPTNAKTTAEYTMVGVIARLTAEFDEQVEREREFTDQLREMKVRSLVEGSTAKKRSLWK